jgi:putative endonuclease
MAYYCYMVLCANGSFYTGWTTDPRRRLSEHNAGRGARFTRMYGPVELVYVEEVADHSSALKREAQIKTYTHARKASLAASTELPDEWIELRETNDETERHGS